MEQARGPTSFKDTHELYGELRALHTRAEAALLSRIEIAGDFAYIRSEVDSGPGVWETADTVRTLTSRALLEDAPAAGLARWMLRARNDDGGFPPWPDVSSRQSYTESTARCLLSLLRLEEAVPDLLRDLRASVLTAGKWLLECQSQEGGWGSGPGWGLRTSPTVWALLALGEMERTSSGEDEVARLQAIDAGVGWLVGQQNADGGYGLAARSPSNICSTAQAAWALGFCNAQIQNDHYSRLLSFVDADDFEDEVDEIVDDPARRLFGRFQLLLLARPLGTLGLMACRTDLRDPVVQRVLREISASADDAGLWRIPDGRKIWPSHFYLWAIRTWLSVYESYAKAGLATARPRLSVSDMPPSTTRPGEGHVFLSHAGADKPFVRRLARVLEQAGWTPWVDERALTAGDDLVAGIGDGIRRARAVVLIVTDAFDGTKSWLEYEVTLAVKQQIEGPQGLLIIPVVLEGAEDRLPAKVKHLVWKRASSELDAAAFVLESLARSI
jgi:hypothetical protein